MNCIVPLLVSFLALILQSMLSQAFQSVNREKLDEIKTMIQEGYNKISNVASKHKLVKITEAKRIGANMTMVNAIMEPTECKKIDTKPIESCSPTVSQMIMLSSDKN